MKKIINFLKKVRKEIAIYITILYANRIYYKKVKEADRRHKESEKGEAFYVALAFNTKTLRVYNRAMFRSFKDIFTTKAIYMKDKELLESVLGMKMNNLDGGCFYRTAHRGETDAWDFRQIESRRLSFIDFVLKQAKLK